MMIPRRAEGTGTGDSRAAASPWVPHAGSSQEHQTLCPTDTGCCIQGSSDGTCLAEKPGSNCRLRQTACNVPTSV